MPAVRYVGVRDPRSPPLLGLSVSRFFGLRLFLVSRSLYSVSFLSFLSCCFFVLCLLISLSPVVSRFLGSHCLVSRYFGLSVSLDFSTFRSRLSDSWSLDFSVFRPLVPRFLGIFISRFLGLGLSVGMWTRLGWEFRGKSLTWLLLRVGGRVREMGGGRK